MEDKKDLRSSIHLFKGSDYACKGASAPNLDGAIQTVTAGLRLLPFTQVASWKAAACVGATQHASHFCHCADADQAPTSRVATSTLHIQGACVRKT